MNDPNMTMEEYIKFEEEKSHRRGQVFNWQTATYGKIRVDDNLRSVEAEFPAIVINDTFAPQDALIWSPRMDTAYSDMALPPREQRHQFLRYEGLEYTNSDIADFKSRLERIYTREIHRVHVVDFQGMPELLRDGLYARMEMEHRDEAGVVAFGEVLLDLNALGTIQFQLGGARRRLSWRQFILALGLHTREEMEFPSFARDPVLRLCHRIMAHSIAERSQAPEKVTVTDLFYLRGLDVGSFVARLAEHFRLLTVEILEGLTVIAPEL
ncbi:hypothetical protein Tco_1425967, partial [Tanacetum coccineum]